jgi:hypothetical protein
MSSCWSLCTRSSSSKSHVGLWIPSKALTAARATCLPPALFNRYCAVYRVCPIYIRLHVRATRQRFAPGHGRPPEARARPRAAVAIKKAVSKRARTPCISRSFFEASRRRHSCRRGARSRQRFLEVFYCTHCYQRAQPLHLTASLLQLAAVSSQLCLSKILLEVCDDFDHRFALTSVPTGSALHFFMTNPCAAIAALQPRTVVPGFNVHSRLTSPFFRLVSVHVGRSLAVVVGFVALQWACRYTSHSMKVRASIHAALSRNIFRSL